MKPMHAFPTKFARSLLAMPLLLSAPMQYAAAHHEGGQHADERRAEAPHAAGQHGEAQHAEGQRAEGQHAEAQHAEAPQAGSDDGARLAATCTGCHGTDGKTVGDALPALAGQSKQALLASLMAFKSGERSATVMTQLAKGYNDTDLEKIASFFAAQKTSAAADGSPSARGISSAGPSSSAAPSSAGPGSARPSSAGS